MGLIFIAINLYQLYRLVKDRLSLRLPEADRYLLRNALKQAWRRGEP